MDIGWGAVAVAFAFLLNLVALVAAAMTVKLTVDNLKTAVFRMQETQGEIVKSMTIVTERQRVMKEDVDELDERIDKMEQK